MNSENKTIAFLGDSITEGVGVADIPNSRYDNIIKSKCKLSKVYNYGISGTRIAHQSAASDEPRSDMYFCARAYDIADDADIIMVFGGTNDYGHGDAPFGEMTDKTPDTFCGAVDFLMKLLKEKHPDATIAFLTPARREGDEQIAINPNKRSDAKPLKAYVDVIISKGAQHNIAVLNLYDKLGINPNIPADKEKYAADGLHFNDDGHKILAERVIEFLNNI